MVGAAFGFKVKDVAKSRAADHARGLPAQPDQQGQALPADRRRGAEPDAARGRRAAHAVELPVSATRRCCRASWSASPSSARSCSGPRWSSSASAWPPPATSARSTPKRPSGYIEHRLKCAGSTGKPTFEPEAFDAIYKASRGIPRRINALCDRLLLLGFLCERTHLTVADVDEVVREFAQEAEVPKRARRRRGRRRRRRQRQPGRAGCRCANSTCRSCSLDAGLARGHDPAARRARRRPARRPAAAARAQRAAAGARQPADAGHAEEAGQRRARRHPARRASDARRSRASHAKRTPSPTR